MYQNEWQYICLSKPWEESLEQKYFIVSYIELSTVSLLGYRDRLQRI